MLANTLFPSLSRTHTHTCMHTHPPTHTHAHTNLHTHTCMSTHARAHTHTPPSPPHTHPHPPPLMHTCMHTHTHKHLTPTLTHTHTTHTPHTLLYRLGEKDSCLAEIFKEEKCIEFAYEGRESSFHTFSHFGPHIWNNLLQDVRHSTTLSSFKSRLKTFLFSEYFS